MLEQVENRLCLEQLFKRACLNERERHILDARYGFNGPIRILEAIAFDEGVTRERIRQIECKAIRKMQAAAGLISFSRPVRPPKPPPTTWAAPKAQKRAEPVPAPLPLPSYPSYVHSMWSQRQRAYAMLAAKMVTMDHLPT